MEFIITGGVWFTVPILAMGLASLILILYSLIRILNHNRLGRQLADAILFLGFLSLSFGVFGMILGMFQAAGAIQRAGEVSPALIWEGFRISMITVIMGFVVLFYSLIGWFVIRPYRLDKKS